jgi:magnesium transporter
MTLVSGIYGMNVNSLPLASHPLSFVLIMLLMLTVAGGMLYFFKRRQWL